MAEIAYSVAGVPGGAKITWAGMASGDTGEPFMPGKSSGAVACVQMLGTFGAAVVLQGSNDRVNWATLKNLSGDDISMTADGLMDFSSAALYIRPAPGAVTDVDVILVVRS